MRHFELPPGRRTKSLLASFAGASVLASELVSGLKLTVGDRTLGFDYSTTELIGGTVLGVGLTALGQHLNHKDMREAAIQSQPETPIE